MEQAPQPTRPLDSDEDLWTAFVSGGDRKPLETLVLRHRETALRAAAGVLGNRGEAEDAVSDAVAGFLSGAPRPQRGGSFRAYFAAAARNRALNRRRAVGRAAARFEPLGDLDVAAPDGVPADLAVRREAARALAEALPDLPESIRAAIELQYLVGLTRDEAAEALGIPAGTAASRAARGIEILRERLRQRGIGLPAAAIAWLLAAWTDRASAAAVAGAPAAAAGTSLGVLFKIGGFAVTKQAAGTFLAFGLVLLAAGIAEREDPRPKPPEAPAQKEPAAPAVSWGDAVNGLQAGIELPGAAEGRLREGEPLRVAVHLKNTGTEPLLAFDAGFVQSWRLLLARAGDGKEIPVQPAAEVERGGPLNVELAPGATRSVELSGQLGGREWQFDGAASLPPGRYRLAAQYPSDSPSPASVFGTFPASAWRGTIRTGTVAFEVAGFGADIRWGDAVNGLQAGIELPSAVGGKLRQGESLWAVVHLKNVGKDPLLVFDGAFPYSWRPRLTRANDGREVPSYPAIGPVFGNRGFPENIELAAGESRRVEISQPGQWDFELTEPLAPGRYHLGAEFPTNLFPPGEPVRPPGPPGPPANAWRGAVRTGTAEFEIVGAALQPELKLEVVGPGPVPYGTEIRVEVVLSTDGDRSYEFLLGSFPQAFGLYLAGRAGEIAPDPAKIRPENWMHQEHGTAARITVAKGKPYRATVNLRDYFPVEDVARFPPGVYEVRARFRETGLGMQTPIESGAARFDLVGGGIRY